MIRRSDPEGAEIMRDGGSSIEDYNAAVIFARNISSYSYDNLVFSLVNVSSHVLLKYNSLQIMNGLILTATYHHTSFELPKPTFQSGDFACSLSEYRTIITQSLKMTKLTLSGILVFCLLNFIVLSCTYCRMLLT